MMDSDLKSLPLSSWYAFENISSCNWEALSEIFGFDKVALFLGEMLSMFNDGLHLHQRGIKGGSIKLCSLELTV